MGLIRQKVEMNRSINVAKLLAAILTIWSGGLFFGTNNDAKSQELVNVIGFTGSEPFFLSNLPSQGLGIVPDLFSLIFQDSPYKSEITEIPTTRFLDTIAQNTEFGLWASDSSPIWYSEQEHARLGFSKQKLFEMCHLIVGRKNGAVARNIPDMFNKTLVGIIGFRYGKIESQLSKTPQAGKIHGVRVKTREAAISMIVSERADYFPSSSIRFYWTIAQMNLSKNIFSIQTADAILPCIPIHAMYGAAASASFVAAIDRGIAKLYANSTIPKVLNNYR